MARTITTAEKNAAAAKYARYEASFAGQLNKIYNCKTAGNHTPVKDPYYGNKEFCTTCEEQTN